MSSDALANTINDLRRLADDRKPIIGSSSTPNLGTGSGNPKGKSSDGDIEGEALVDESWRDVFEVLAEVNASSNKKGDREGMGSNQNRRSNQGLRKTPKTGGASTFGIQERPASRAEIFALENELEERIRLILDFEHSNTRALQQAVTTQSGHTIIPTQEGVESGAAGVLFHPSKENLRVTRERMLAALGSSPASLAVEPWLDSFVKCECLKVMCDEVSSKLSDMLSVSSTEFGNVLRKLRLTYKQTFEQMRQSWMTMRKAFEQTKKQLARASDKNAQLDFQLQNKDNQAQSEFDAELQRLNAEFNAERQRDQEKLKQTEFKMDQMSDTLKYLNEIFKTMQADASSAKTSDLVSKVQRLEQENRELSAQNLSLDETKARLAAAERKIQQLQAAKLANDEEIARLNMQLERREEVVKELMEKEALRNAEIEKLQKIAKLKDDEMVSMDLKDAATSVLCIKCKKSLDDLSNIKSAIMGTRGEKALVRMQCENFRILLPNLRGRRPNRPTAWLRSCMRSILVSKMREDVNLQSIHGSVSRFPAYVYSWFCRDLSEVEGSNLTKTLQAADEDRWGMYYGVKALAKEDPESMVFWTLLDEAHGEDGLQFVMHCLGVVLSLGGNGLWRQFGTAFTHCASINMKSKADSSAENVRTTIWLDIDTAKEAVRHILVRAMAPHVHEAIEAVDALTERPSDEELLQLDRIRGRGRGKNGAGSVQFPESEDPSVAAGMEGSIGEAGAFSISPSMEAADEATANEAASIDGEEPNPASTSPRPTSTAASATAPEDATLADPLLAASSTEGAKLHSFGNDSMMPTHINLFMWLRLMLQQLHADQIHRSAAIRLMFETASVGALTPAPTAAAGGAARHGDGRATAGGSAGSNAGYVEYPQFQSICQTLFPTVSVSEIASLYAACYAAGSQRVTSEVFVKQANQFGMFSLSMRLPLLPVLRVHVECAEESHNTAVAAAEDAHAVNRSSSAAVPHTAAAVVARALTYSEETIEMVRNKLTTTIHRKLASVSPSIRYLMRHAPEKWAVLLADALAQVELVLKETSNMKPPSQRSGANNNKGTSSVNSTRPPTREGLRSSGADGEENEEERTRFVYGLQPFVCYKRLIALATFVKSLTDNPLLPTDLFSLSDLRRNDTATIHFSLTRAEKVLTALEQGVLISSVGARSLGGMFAGGRGGIAGSAAGPGADSSGLGYSGFDRVRFNLVARRLQACVRKYLYADVPVPKAVRGCITAGYLANSRAPGPVKLKNGLKHREVLLEPWWGQAMVAEVFSFKLTYDLKASTLGLAPIPLAQAVVAHQFCACGSLEVAERAVHDLFVAIRSYKQGVPRLRMFAAFLGGDGSRDSLLDASVLEVLQTPYAVQLYLNLLMEVHREANRRRHASQDPQRSAELTSMGLEPSTAGGEAAGGGKSSRGSSRGGGSRGHNSRPSSGSGGAGSKKGGSSSGGDRKNSGIVARGEQVYEVFHPSTIEVLFPSTENSFQRADKREVWFVQVSLLIAAVIRWSRRYQAKTLGIDLADGDNGIEGGMVGFGGAGAGMAEPGQQAAALGAASGSSGADDVEALNDEELAKYALYTDLVEQLKRNDAGLVEVDDCLWIVMVQWAKLASWNVKRSAMRSALLESDYPGVKYFPSGNGIESTAKNPGSARRGSSSAATAASSSLVVSAGGLAGAGRNGASGGAGGSVAGVHRVKSNTVPPLPISNLRAMVESIYRPGEGAELADPSFYGSNYVQRLAIHKIGLLKPGDLPAGSAASTAASSGGGMGGGSGGGAGGMGVSVHSIAPRRVVQSMEALLKECVLWDTSANGSAQFHRKPLSPALLAQQIAARAAGNEGALAGAGASGQQGLLGGGLQAGGFLSVAAGTAPEVSFAAAKKAFYMYQEPISQTISRISVLATVSSQMELDRKIQDIRVLLLNLSEIFSHSTSNIATAAGATSSSTSSATAAVGSGGGEGAAAAGGGDFGGAGSLSAQTGSGSSSAQAPEYLTYLMHVSTKGSSSSAGGAGRHSSNSGKHQSGGVAGAEKQLLKLQQSYVRVQMFARDAWATLQALFTAVSELVISVGEEFPRDAWHSGVKVHVDRAFVYNIHTKTSI